MGVCVRVRVIVSGKYINVDFLTLTIYSLHFIYLLYHERICVFFQKLYVSVFLLCFDVTREVNILIIEAILSLLRQQRFVFPSRQGPSSIAVEE